MILLFFLEVVANPTTNLLGVVYLCVMSTKEQEQSRSRGLLRNYQQESREWYFTEFASLTSELQRQKTPGKEDKIDHLLHG